MKKARIEIILRLERKNIKGVCPVVLKYYAYKKTKWISLNIFVKSEHWDENKKTILKKDLDYFPENQLLENYVIRANNIKHEATSTTC